MNAKNEDITYKKLLVAAELFIAYSSKSISLVSQVKGSRQKASYNTVALLWSPSNLLMQVSN